jgi:hypothetical protein
MAGLNSGTIKNPMAISATSTRILHQTQTLHMPTSRWHLTCVASAKHSQWNNAAVINSEIRVPVFSSFFNRPVNNAFLRNFQLVQFFDLDCMEWQI